MAAFFHPIWGKFCRCFYILFVLVMASTIALALDPEKSFKQYIHNTWTSGGGLPENKIQTIAQTSDGYLWFGTQHGLLRFNGYDFTIFDESNVTEMHYSSIVCLHSSHSGGLWIGTMGGGLLFFNKEQFTAYDLEDELSSNFVTTLKEAPDGKLWIGTENHGLNILENGKIFPIDFSAGQQVRQIIRDPSGDIWVVTSSGLQRFPGGDYQAPPQRFGLEDVAISSILMDEAGRMWIGTEGRGIFLFSDGEIQRNILTKELRHDVIHYLLKDKDGCLWIGTRSGLLRFFKEEIESFTVSDGLTNNEVFALLEDKEGSIWIGTHYGLNRLKERTITILDTESGLNVDPVWTIFKDKDQNLWVGTNNGGLSKISGKTIETFTMDNGLPSNVIRSIYQEEEGDLWIGTIKGLARMKPDGRVVKVYGRREGLGNEIIRVIHKDRLGVFWLGTNNGVFQIEGNTVTPYPLAKDSSQIMIFCIKEDRHGSLWLGTHTGVFKITKTGPERYGALSPLRNTIILDLFIDKENTLWFATPRGLYRNSDGIFTLYQRTDGLLDNMIYSVRIDGDDNLWMSSNQGIFYFKREDLIQYDRTSNIPLKPRFFDLNDGMKSLECNGGSQPSSLITENGTLWFPTMRGAVGIDRNKMKFSGLALPLIIEGILVDGKPVPVKSPLEMKPGTRRIEFRYAALTFLYPEKTEYKTKLENFENDWMEARNKNSIYYTNLPPGDYIFRVMASRGGGNWTDPGVSFSFTQKAHFHQTFLFYLISVLAAILVGLGLFRLRVRHLVTREKTLKEFIGKQTLQLEKANKELERLSIQDHLTGIFNHRMFSQFLNYEWKRAIRRYLPISLIMIDIDFFKLYNDNYGHMAGDDCLRKVAVSLQQVGQRSSDMVARYGGDEFVMVLSETDKEGAYRVAEKARSLIERIKIPHETSLISTYVTISLGCATIKPQRNQNASILLKAADGALYLSKQNGRNRTTFVDPTRYNAATH
ncbi:MAG: diguanylate cyclase [Candidatus Aminicenantes bacterium]|nr:diguanylate cyclase [Candidatus Aminicenantes bacterium]